MATAAGVIRSGICSNFGNCSIADARGTVELTTGMDLVCPECGKPLLLKEGTASGAGGKTGMIVMGVALALLLAAGGAWFFGSKTPPDATVKSAPAVTEKADKPAPPPPPTVEEKPKPVPATPAVLPSGDCSPDDEKAGVCKIQR